MRTTKLNYASAIIILVTLVFLCISLAICIAEYVIGDVPSICYTILGLSLDMSILGVAIGVPITIATLVQFIRYWYSDKEE